MRTVPLYGKKARGRVALVDDEDYDLVMQYRWYVQEVIEPGKRPRGPYAYTFIREDARQRRLTMHGLILGVKGGDHINHNTLDNRRSELRPATARQNLANSRPRIGASSEFKGVSWVSGKKRWRAAVGAKEAKRPLGYFDNEVEAAYAYDAAARELYGEFARTNFPEPATQEMQDQWQAERAERRAAFCADRSRRMRDRAPRTYTCEVCNTDFQSTSLRPRSYCSKACSDEGHLRRARARKGPRPEPPVRACAVCGTDYRSESAVRIYCSAACRDEAEKIASAARQPRPRWRGRKEPGVRTCAECGDEFRPKIDHPKAAYCSPKCCRTARTKRAA